MGSRTFAALLLLASPPTAAAQEAEEAAAMRAIEATVPHQDWYPTGYYDIRIAAEAEVAEIAAQPAAVRPATPGGDFNLIACDAQKIDPRASDPLLQRYGYVALETSRLRGQISRLGYPASAAAEPLLAFERDRIAVADGGDGTRDPYEALAEALNAARPGTGALPEVFAFAECTPPPMAAPSPAPVPRRGAAAFRAPRAPGVTFVTQPPAGEVLLINAFAFKVCTRRQANPWDRFACQWNEVETGIAKPLSGRFVYQVRWPDGTVRKGTRELLSGQSGAAATVTFRKTGS